jgi:hypothetical protein
MLHGSCRLQAPSSTAGGPVSFVRSHGHSIRVKRTSTMPSFLLPITDAKVQQLRPSGSRAQHATACTHTAWMPTAMTLQVQHPVCRCHVSDKLIYSKAPPTHCHFYVCVVQIDPDVSSMIENYGATEGGLSRVSGCRVLVWARTDARGRT